MDSPKVTFICGNGYDLSMGMKTSYEGFYHRLCKNHFFENNSQNDVIKHIYETEKHERWYSFEHDILQYALKSSKTKTLRTAKKVLELIENFEMGEKIDVIDNDDFKNIVLSLEIPVPKSPMEIATQDSLHAILIDVKSKINHFQNVCKSEAEEALKLLQEELYEYLKKTSPSGDPKFRYPTSIRVLAAALGMNHYSFDNIQDSFKELYDDENDYFSLGKLQIVTFNYTNFLMETFKVFPFKEEKRPLTAYHKIVSNPPVYYIHGDLDGNLIFGCNSHDKIPDEFDCLTKAFQLRENTFAKLRGLMSNSDIVIVYGQSIDGIDFDYYRDFLKDIPSKTEFYVFDTSIERINGCKYNLRNLLGKTPILNFVNINNLYEFENALDSIKKRVES